MIGPSGSLLVVSPTYLLSQSQCYGWGCEKQITKLGCEKISILQGHILSTTGDAFRNHDILDQQKRHAILLALKIVALEGTRSGQLIKAADYDYLNTWASLTLIILFSEMLKFSKKIISTFLKIKKEKS
jgi:hypothetical protein